MSAGPFADELPDSEPDWYGQQKKNDWETPAWLYEGIADAVGGINLDPCAGIDTDIGDTNWSIHRDEDGLQREWFGTVFVNPPFSEKTAWIEKIARERENVECIILLTPDSTDVQSWFHDGIVPMASYFWFSEGRTPFVDPESGEQMDSPTFGTMLSLIGDVPDTLCEWLSDHGLLVEQVDTGRY